MKKSLKIVLTAGFLVAAFGAGFTFCTSKSDKPVAENQDTVKVDSGLVVKADSTVSTPEDSAVTK